MSYLASVPRYLLTNAETSRPPGADSRGPASAVTRTPAQMLAYRVRQLANTHRPDWTSSAPSAFVSLARCP